MAAKKRAVKRETLTEQITFRITPALRGWLERQVGKLPDVRNASEAARAILEERRRAKP